MNRKIERQKTYSELEEEAIRKKMVIIHYRENGKKMAAFFERGQRFHTQDGREYEVDENGSLRRIRETETTGG